MFSIPIVPFLKIYNGNLVNVMVIVKKNWKLILLAQGWQGYFTKLWNLIDL